MYKIKQTVLAILIIFILFPNSAVAESRYQLITSDSCRVCIGFEKEHKDVLNGFNRLTIETPEGLAVFTKDKEKDLTLIVPYIRDTKTGEVVATKDYIVDFVNSNFEDKESSVSTLGVWGVTLLSAIVDSFNPCALFAIIYMISTLTSLNHGKKKLTAYLILYSSVIFAVYTGIGYISLVILNSLLNLSWLPRITGALIIITTSFFLIKTLQPETKASKNPTDIVLDKLNNNNKSLILVISSIAFIIALTEFACTGQVYLPTLMIIQDSGRNFLPFLLTYNIIFIAPIIIVGMIYIHIEEKASSVMSVLLNSKERAKWASVALYIIIIIYALFKYVI